MNHRSLTELAAVYKAKGHPRPNLAAVLHDQWERSAGLADDEELNPRGVLVLRALASAAEVDPTSCRSLADLEAAAHRGGSMSTPNYLTRATAL